MLAFVLALAVTTITQETTTSPAPRTGTATAAPRSIQSALVIAGRSAVTLDVRSPRIEQTELERMLEKPELLDTLNSKHLAQCGELTAHRSFMIGEDHFPAGQYAVGVAIAADGALSLRLAQDGTTTNVVLENHSTSDSKRAVPQVSFAFLAGSEIEAFRLELRFGVYAASASLEFSMPRIIVELNNTAHDLLSKSDRDARDVVKALYLAGRATKMTSDANPLILDTFALALFHAGQVDAAIETQNRALALLEQSQDAHRKGMTERLAAYRTARGN